MPEPVLTPFERLALAFQLFFWILFQADVAEGAARLRDAHRRALAGVPPQGAPPTGESTASRATVETRAEPGGGGSSAGAGPLTPTLSPAGAGEREVGVARPGGAGERETPASAPPKPVEAPPKPVVEAPKKAEDPKRSALQLLGALQREGRLVDFLEEDLAGFPDASIGAAARTVHAGCKRVLAELFELEPVYREGEGATVTVVEGFDASAIRLTGNVVGKPPFKGALRHHGWRAKRVKLPPAPDGADPAILAPAEVEL